MWAKFYFTTLQFVMSFMIGSANYIYFLLKEIFIVTSHCDTSRYKENNTQHNNCNGVKKSTLKLNKGWARSVATKQNPYIKDTVIRSSMCYVTFV